MSIDFSKVTALSDQYGNIVEIKDASGRVLWAVQSNAPVILEVEKIASDTYAGETTYAGEQFILLDIYPKTNGTVKVTYGGLTKTITDTSGAEEPNAQRVFFGTFNGVTDEVATPASGELVIEGSFYAFGCASYTSSSKGIAARCGCITAIYEFGSITEIAPSAFFDCVASEAYETLEIPKGVTSIGASAFGSGTTTEPFGITTLILPSTIKSIGISAFSDQYTYTSGGTSTYTGSKPSILNCVIRATTPPSLGANAFGEYEPGMDLHIIVPKGCGEVYKAAAGWSDYAKYIVEES